MNAQDKSEEVLLELADILELAATKIRTTLTGTGVTETHGQPAYDVTKINCAETGMGLVEQSAKAAAMVDLALPRVHDPPARPNGLSTPRASGTRMAHSS